MRFPFRSIPYHPRKCSLSPTTAGGLSRSADYGIIMVGQACKLTQEVKHGRKKERAEAFGGGLASKLQSSTS
jgi:hypothetical protein